MVGIAQDSECADAAEFCNLKRLCLLYVNHICILNILGELTNLINIFDYSSCILSAIMIRTLEGIHSYTF